MKVTILGCGPSGGVPSITGNWGKCEPENPKNRRSRCSLLIEYQGLNIVVDTSPDIKEQFLRLETPPSHIDAVLYTHAHADHINGIDDLRAFFYETGRLIKAYGPQETLEDLEQKFPHNFTTMVEPGSFYKAFIDPVGILNYETFSIGDLAIKPFKQLHGDMTSAGYRFEKIAYSTDVLTLPEEAFDALTGLDVWIVDCLSYKPAPTHSYLSQTLGWIDRVKPKRAILTHMGLNLDYDELRSKLPSHVCPAHDGMVIEV